MSEGEQFAGSVRWAVVPYAPKPPFRLYAGPGSDPIVVPEVDTVIAAARRGGDAELSYIVSGKARPVLILSEPDRRHHREVTALRLLRLSRLEPDERARVLAGADDLLFPLDPARFHLPEACAAIISALVRLDIAAIGSGASLGRLDGNESRAIGEGVIRHYGFDTRGLVERHITELVARHKARSSDL